MQPNKRRKTEFSNRSYCKSSRNHDKNVVFKKCTEKWELDQELCLLDNVRRFKSWKEISISLGPNFTPEEVQDHFIQYYMKGTLGQVWNYQLVQNPILCCDHTVDEPDNSNTLTKYLPLVKSDNLKSIQFFPHREEFAKYPEDESEKMVTQLDFSTFYISNFEYLKIDEEMRALQLAIIDSYRKTVAERIALRKFMKDYKLIEQFFIMEKQHKQYKTKVTCSVESFFKDMKKFIPFFDSSTGFLNFYYECLKEELLKLEITRLVRKIQKKKEKKSSAQNSERNISLEKTVPSFLNAGLLLNNDNNVVLLRGRRKKRKFKFTRKKGCSR